MANVSSCVYLALNEFHGVKNVNWAGFYLVNQKDLLVLGPFMGKPAVTRIPFSKGVCGACATSAKTQLVPDVHDFPGHIACDSASNSEIVIPMFSKDGTLRGLLDLDSPVVNGFDTVDQEGLERIASLVGHQSDWEEGIATSSKRTFKLGS
jgi:L-methionine (R)-S-oxide reductase